MRPVHRRLGVGSGGSLQGDQRTKSAGGGGGCINYNIKK